MSKMTLHFQTVVETREVPKLNGVVGDLIPDREIVSLLDRKNQLGGQAPLAFQRKAQKEREREDYCMLHRVCTFVKATSNIAQTATLKMNKERREHFTAFFSWGTLVPVKRTATQIMLCNPPGMV